jgi:hypothetical protein
VPETQAAERRTWNSKPSEEMRVTKGDAKGDGNGGVEVVAGSVVVVVVGASSVV